MNFSKSIYGIFSDPTTVLSSLDRLDTEKAGISFEKANQQKVIFEKLGIQKSVQVMTIHKSKGREFDGVVLVLEDNHKALWKKDGPASGPEIDDLYRVAISRARSAFALVAFEDARKDMHCVNHLLYDWISDPFYRSQ